MKYVIVILSILVGVYIHYASISIPFSEEVQSFRLTGKNYGWKSSQENRTHIIFYQDYVSPQSKQDNVLVLLHGFPTSSYDWVKVLPSLQQTFDRIIAPDFLGFGFSYTDCNAKSLIFRDKPIDHTYSIHEQADIVQSLLSHLKIKTYHILCHDYAVSVAQELLSRQQVNMVRFYNF